MTPSAMPPPATAPQTPRARLRSWPSGKVTVKMESAAGEIIAPPSPWTARAPISMPEDRARPQASEPAVKRSRPADQQRAATQQISGATAEQQEAGEHEGIGVHHPLQVLRREVKRGLHRRQCDIHDRDVDDHHQLGQAHQDECCRLVDSRAISPGRARRGVGSDAFRAICTFPFLAPPSDPALYVAWR